MDYLDPKKKLAHRRRLYVGYGLMSIVIAISTVILVYLGSGYYVDKTGDLIQNGQILVSSEPEGASIYLNDNLQKTKTTGKLVVPSGAHNISVRKEGYREWNKKVALDGGSIQRLDYILLVPENIVSSITQTFAETPTQITQSLDRRYVSFIFAERPNAVLLYDLVKPEQPAIEISLPQNLLKNPAVAANFSLIEWSDDNKHMLIANKDLSGAVLDYLLVSRDQNEQTINLSQRYGLTTQQLQLINKKRDSFFVYDAATKTLQTTNLGTTTLTSRLTDVFDYRAYDSNTILYVTASPEPDKVLVRMTDGAETYLIRELPVGSGYVFSIARLGSTYVLGVGSTKDNKVAIYRNPIGYLKANPNLALPLATTIFQIDSPQYIQFSTDNSVVMVRGENKLATHYFEEDKTTRFNSPIALKPGSVVTWADGKHILLTSEGKVTIVDFDGTNAQQLGETNDSFGAFFDTNFRSVYTFGNTLRPFNITRLSMVVSEK